MVGEPADDQAGGRKSAGSWLASVMRGVHDKAYGTSGFPVEMKAPNGERRYIDALAALGTVRVYAKNTILIQEGDKSDQLYVVLSGKLRVFLADHEGKEVTIDILGPDQYFGEMALEGEPRSASVMTTEPTKLSVIERSQFRQLFATNPEYGRSLFSRTERARETSKQPQAQAPSRRQARPSFSNSPS
jgi:CRP-like cAMP-binding protein